MFGCMLTSLGYRQPQLCLAVGLPPSGIALFIFGCMFTLSGIDSLSFVWLQTYLPREQIPFALFGAVFGCRFTPFGYRQHQLCLAVDLPPLCFVWSCVWLQVYPCRVQIAFALFGCRLTSPLLCLELCLAVGLPLSGIDSISFVWLQTYPPFALFGAVFGCRFTPFGYRQHQLCFALRLPPLYIENNICSAVGVPPMGTDSISCVCLYAYPPRTNSHSCVWIQVYLPMAKIASAVFDCRPSGTNSPSCVCLQVYLPEVQISVIYNCLWLQTNLL